MPKQNLLGEDGCIVIDTLETYEMAKEALHIFQDQFNLGTPSKPIKAIIKKLSGANYLLTLTSTAGALVVRTV